MMSIAIQKAQQLPTQLTSIHTDLAQVRKVINLRSNVQTLFSIWVQQLYIYTVGTVGRYINCTQTDNQLI